MFVHIERSGRTACRLIVTGAVLLFLTGAAGSVRAQTPGAPRGPEFAPVPSLFERVHESFSGRILTIALTLSEPPAYEVKLLTEKGNVLMLSYDAMTLRLDSVIGHREADDEKPAEVTFVRDRNGNGGSGGDDGRGDGDNDRDDGDDHDKDKDDDHDDDHGGNSGPGGGGNSGPGGGDDD